jgi:C-terminal processing protease CtpA/Prc
MRGYPLANQDEIAQRLIPQPFLSPHYNLQVETGPDDISPFDDQSTLYPLGDPAWSGPLVLLTGPYAVSAAEDFMQFLVGAHRPLAVVGRRSAGTNGNITGVQLPGGFEFTYTGMQVLNPDGTRFHGVGIAPDLNVDVTAADLRDGIDRALLTAIGVLQGN